MEKGNTAIGKLIIQLRKSRNLSQERTANESGVDRRYLSDLENDRRNPSLSVVYRLAAYFGLTLSQFFKLAETVESSPKVSDALCDAGYEDAVIFRNPDFEQAFIGITEDGRAVYSYELMIASLIAEGMDYEDAVEFIDYNTLRALPYMGYKAPVVMYECR